MRVVNMEFVILVGIGLLISIGLLAFFIAKGIAKKEPESNPKQVKASTKVRLKEPYSTIRFRYRDREGNETERTVDVVTGKRGETFKAFCHLRKEERTFFFNRIAGFEVIDVVSGETLTPMEWRFRLQGTKVALSELESEREAMRALNGEKGSNPNGTS
jgi:hypothetical protein